MDKIFNNLTILYIEDEKNIRETLTSSLQIMFNSVFATENAEDALEIYTHKHIDIILSDIGLPGMDGINFVKIIRETNKEIPIILLTAYTDTDILLEAIKLKLISYLTKPITLDTLLKALKDAQNELPKKSIDTLIITNNIKYDIKKKILSKNGNNLHLTHSEDKLLNIFIDNRTRTLSIIEIKELLWDDSYYTTDTAFKSLLNKLRKKIGTNTIKNISGVGYYLVLSK